MTASHQSEYLLISVRDALPFRGEHSLCREICAMRHMIFQQHHSQFGLRWEQEEMCQHFRVSACRSGVPGPAACCGHTCHGQHQGCAGLCSACRAVSPSPTASQGPSAPLCAGAAVSQQGRPCSETLCEHDSVPHALWGWD